MTTTMAAVAGSATPRVIRKHRAEGGKAATPHPAGAMTTTEALTEGGTTTTIVVPAAAPATIGDRRLAALGMMIAVQTEAGSAIPKATPKRPAEAGSIASRREGAMMMRTAVSRQVAKTIGRVGGTQMTTAG